MFQAQAPVPQNSNEYQFKLDHTLSTAHQLTGSYFTNRGQNTEALAGNLPWSMRSFVWAQQNYNVGDTWVISPTVVNQFRLTYVRDIGGRVNSAGNVVGRSRIEVPDPGRQVAPQITVTGAFTLGQAIAGNVFGSNYYGLRELHSRTIGRHSLKLGGEFSLEKAVSETTLNNYGTFSFQGNRTGNALADFSSACPRP